MALTPALEAFLGSRIDSVEQLELLLLVARGAAAWTPDSAGERLGIAPELAAAKLDALVAARLLSRNAREFRYAPADAEIRRLVADLAREYADHRATVINVIYSADLERLRKFADAFRLRKR